MPSWIDRFKELQLPISWPPKSPTPPMFLFVWHHSDSFEGGAVWAIAPDLEAARAKLAADGRTYPCIQAQEPDVYPMDQLASGDDIFIV